MIVGSLVVILAQSCWRVVVRRGGGDIEGGRPSVKWGVVMRRDWNSAWYLSNIFTTRNRQQLSCSQGERHTQHASGSSHSPAATIRNIISSSCFSSNYSNATFKLENLCYILILHLQVIVSMQFVYGRNFCGNFRFVSFWLVVHVKISINLTKTNGKNHRKQSWK